MSLPPIPFQIIDWTDLPHTHQNGTAGQASRQSLQLPGLRIRIVDYSPGYLADHWCQVGHVVHCLEGEVTTELETGEKFLLKKGMTYVVSDNMSSHRSVTSTGVKLLIMDGDFLNRV
jgi:quercetin dioxygenase-like cupin family protein